MSITEVDDLTMFCRVCLQMPAESELLDLNLIYDEDEQLTYYDCFTMCTQIQISDGEGLPQNLCRSCGLELQMAYDFYKKVDESKRFLIQLKNQQAKGFGQASAETENYENMEEGEEVEVEVEEEVDVDGTTTHVSATHEQEVVEQEQEQDELMQEEEEVVDGDGENMEEHLEVEDDYQAIEHLDDEELDYKYGVTEIKDEILDEADDVISIVNHDLINVYQEFQMENAKDEAANQENLTTKPKTPLQGNEKFSESENDDADEVTFEDLYEKVFEDIHNEGTAQQPDAHQENVSKIQPAKRRKRGRPRQKHYYDDDSDDPDAALDEMTEACVKQNDTATTKIQQPPSIEKNVDNNGGDDDDDDEDIDGDLQQLSDSAVSAAAASELPVAATAPNGAIVPTQQKKRRGPPTILVYNGPTYECEICHAECKSRSLLNSHRFRKHRAKPEPRFKCPKCQRKFTTQDSLEKHKRRPTCESYPQFECEHCGKMCVGLSNYNIHLRFHKRQYPFVCHLCGKKFMMCVHLNEHVLVKHENKRYPCEHPGCGKLFQTRNSLYNHTYLHTGIMPFECEYCKRGYASKSRLRYHCKKSHNIDHTIEELDRMQVTEKLPNPVVKPQ